MFGQSQSTAGSATTTQSLFGSTAPSGGFSFGAPTGAAPSGGFSFGQTSATQKPGGFSFGSQSAQPAPSFSFGAAPAQTQAQAQTQGQTTGTFSFGVTPAQTQAQTQANPSFSFVSSAATTQSSLGFSLGGTTTSTQAAAPGLSLGGAASGGFKFGEAAKPAATTSASTGGFSFPAPSATSQAAVGFSLGQQTQSVGTPASSAAANTTSAPASGGFSLGGGFKLGGTPASGTTTSSTAAVQPTQAATTTSSTGGLGGLVGGGTKLGGFSLPTSSSQNAASLGTGLKMVTTTTSSSGLSLGAPATSTPSLGGGLKLGGLLGTPASSAATSSTPGLGLLGAKTATSTAPTSGLGTTATAPAATMSYRELEQCINKWTVELEEQEKVFLHQAAQVNAWDRMLVNNGEKITTLHTDLETVKADQQRLEHELDYIVSQQRELEDILVPLEEACKTQEGSLYRQHTDIERERTYQMSENIDSQLKRMVQDLKEIIDHMNTSSTPTDQADPISQVAKILNAHMNSLQWIDQNTGLLQRKVDEVSRQYEIVKRDQERNVHLAFE